MRTFLISAATAIAAVAAASPATAQYYPQQNNGYGYQQGYQNGYNQPQYGYGNQYQDQQGLIRSYLVRADQLRQRVERNDNRDRISERETYRLRRAAIDLQNRTRAYARNGLDNGERRDLDVRFAQLQQALRYERRDGRGNGYGNGYNNGNQGYYQNDYERHDRKEHNDRRDRHDDDDD